ncbi:MULTISPECIES: BglG family transcription antiterminator [Clostridium]|uniref:Putative licABCH operon regulator n=2 Tax=Clostridium TaxID=1485 RepID=A0A151AI15_9CLOT|nr:MULTISPECIES: PTS sugar transporter subunit IIA [Clostridium]KYH27326.1 putative licABCH operon regulator [Clostridium colicanis DSM 13634]MBE6043509.1 PRD domain-containing protein [Clostridium thermopalmarium]PRR74812.1 putative licABCH operon regulator [Clostridium thermopalmarium DSM 5974]PVZ15884.1 lichenan operon transcriptional antiterminator [Clostridium thermopalmarium DSM 5974]
MLSYANRNILLNLLLLKNNLPMEGIIGEVGSKDEVWNYVRELNNMYKNELKIDIAKNENKIMLSFYDKDKFYKNLYMRNTHDFNDFRCRIAYLFNELINKGTYLNILDLSDYMNVSRGTVNNDLRKAKSLLKKYNAEIVGVPNKGIKFNSNEFSKRLVLIYEVFDYFPSDILLNNKFMKLIESLANYYKIDSSTEYLLYKTIVVSICRIKGGNHLNFRIPMYKNFESNSEVLNNFIKKVERIFKIKFSSEEIDFISFPINIRNSSHINAMNNSQNEELLFDIVSQMLKSVEEKFMIHIDEYDFFNQVKYHLLFLINRLTFKIPVKDIFSNQIKIRFPLAFELAKMSMNVLYEQYRLVGTMVDVSYLAVYFALILDERKSNHEKNKTIKKVAVATNGGRGVFELIRRQLQEILGTNSQIDFLTVSDLVTKDTSEYGILFSTENIITDVHMPVIYINGIIDYTYLTRKINEIGNKEFSFIEDISKIVDFKVMHLDAENGYRNNVKIITNRLVEEGCVSNNIYQVFEEKDKQSSMIYENGVAFPHLTDKVIDKLSLTLGIIKPITDSLKIIFFLVIPENMNSQQEDSLMKIYDQIFTIISKKELVNNLQYVNSLEDLYTLNERKLLA